MSGGQFKYSSHMHLTVDVVPGRGSGFSVEAPEGVRFGDQVPPDRRLCLNAKKAGLEVQRQIRYGYGVLGASCGGPMVGAARRTYIRCFLCEAGF